MAAAMNTLAEALAMCPICREELDDVSTVPRRMPCCEQPICEVCLNTYIERRPLFPCPLCRAKVVLPGGAKSLPKDMTVLRFREARRFTGPHRTELKTKYEEVTLRMNKFSDIKENISKSQKRATEQINKRFDDMLDELQHRRGILLSQVEAKADKERKSIKRALGFHKYLLDELKSASTSGISVASFLQEIPGNVEAKRIAVTFTEVNMQQLLSTIRSAGQVRLVTFTPTQRPNDVPEDDFYNAVKFSPGDFPEVTGFTDQTDVKLILGGKDVIGPHLEFDHNTSSADVQISSRVVSNMVPDPAPQDTGCRLQSGRIAMTLRPLPLRRGQVVVLFTRVMFTVKQLTNEGYYIWETSVTGSPVDTDWGQASGLRVGVVACNTHKHQLCLKVLYDEKLLIDVPFIRNQVGVSRDIDMCIVIDTDSNKIHVVDVTDVKVITTTEASLDRPLWVLMYVDLPSDTEVKSELISGRELTLTPEIKHLLSKLN